ELDPDPTTLEYYERTGRVSAADVEMTRTLAAWADGTEAIPEVLVERGRLLRVDADTNATQAERDEAASAIDALGASPVGDKLAIRLADIADGTEDLDSLKDKEFGWAAASTFWGYRDLGIETLADDQFDMGTALGLPKSMHLVFAIAPFAIGAGYLSGRAGLMVTAGGVLAYLVLNPALHAMGFLPSTVSAEQVATSWGRGNIGKPLGIGLLCGGALMGVVVTLPMIKAALSSLIAAAGSGRSSDELGMKTLTVATAGAFVLLFVTSYFSEGEASNRVCPVTNATLVAVGTPEPHDLPTADFGGYSIQFEHEAALATWDGWDDDQRLERLRAINSAPGLLASLPTPLRAFLIAVVGSVWIWFAGIVIAQCTGMTDWSPISGIALLTVVLVLMLAGVGAVIPAVLVGATLCCAITMSADMMADLRTGYIVGSIPKRQQIVELLTTWIGPVVCMLTVLLIAQATTENSGRPMGEGTDIPAAQAVALHSIITGVQGGDLPYVLYGLGG
ncbi:MAG: OPT/YSL family transporter, partial [Phycisphaerales bacterium]|nr:OPT/YSL family transporter [Phycisphaerales bacterium]